MPRGFIHPLIVIRIVGTVEGIVYIPPAVPVEFVVEMIAIAVIEEQMRLRHCPSDNLLRKPVVFKDFPGENIPDNPFDIGVRLFREVFRIVCGKLVLGRQNPDNGTVVRETSRANTAQNHPYVGAPNRVTIRNQILRHDNQSRLANLLSRIEQEKMGFDPVKSQKSFCRPGGQSCLTGGFIIPPFWHLDYLVDNRF